MTYLDLPPYGGTPLQPATTYYFKVMTHFTYDCSDPLDSVPDECMSNPVSAAGRTAAVSTPATTTNILPAPGVVTAKYYLNAIMVGWSTISDADGYLPYTAA